VKLKKVMFLAIMCLPLAVIAQNMQLISFPASNGVEYKQGVRLYLGTGSNPDKSFRYALRNSHRSVSNLHLPSTSIGKSLTVKRVKQSGSKKAGYIVYLVCVDHNSVNYWVQIERAISAGEVVNPLK